MIDISLNEISKYYGANKVLEDITFEIHSGDRIGLIGKNGTGKTTILKIIAGIENSDGGILSIRKNATIGYLAQMPDYPKEYKVIDVLNTAFERQNEIKAKMRELENKMSSSNEDEIEKIMKNYGELQYTYEHIGGYEIEEKLNRVCTGLKFTESMLERNFGNLSGGEKTTVMLGNMLLQNPDILLLDEPSNHLDLESVEWLEEFIKEYQGSVLVISHDRYFLDNIATKIIEVESKKSKTYIGNYSFYVQYKEEMLNLQLEAYKTQQKKIKQMEEAIKRFREWGTIAGDEPMFKKAANMEKRIEKMDKVEKPILNQPKIKVNFTRGERSANEVVRINGLKKSFGENVILENLDLSVRYKERLCILGKNGSGKSTLIKLLLNKYTQDEGEIILGSRVRIGYLEQEIFFEDEEKTVLEAINEYFMVPEGEGRRILAGFLFRGQDVFKKIKSLSGGEKSRLRLCIMMQEQNNLLILDEPTNHLDIDSREMLEKALENYDGTIIFISHDRYFINKLAERIVEIDNRKLIEYLGDYNYYKEKKSEIKMALIADKIKAHEVKPINKRHKDNNISPEAEEAKKKRKASFLEEEIQELEDLISQIDSQMEKVAYDHEKLSELYNEKESLTSKYEGLLAKWVELSS
ncbi:ribosomal protection-like ABC-F family protein [Proteiniborus sp. MB09-C3]|uniref:ribosomal protection-like ABC-F family protein n=1 Tax=Proteiniborus sp. MB09-C3 TaxID=3050072 RepID=UPI0025540C93|nr:ABC-F family ATP-binding cassette domain-containing protein [Proteiniborus sp. MB09-C3]WIV13306.1 ABC-F family ATP-binding cassette domain-containing protein [Proteiniborus sp. MB09-C3]